MPERSIERTPLGCLAAAVSPMCCLAGIPVAGWCLVALHAPGVRAAFD